MQRFVCLMTFFVLILSIPCMTASATLLHLPESLTVLDSEALKGTALNGVLELSSTQLEVIADGALDGISLQGIVLPASIAHVGQQSLTYGPVWAFVWADDSLTCAADELNGLGSVRFLISAYGNAGKIQGAEYIYMGEAVFYDGFIYHLQNGEARLLCAIDNREIPASVRIPAAVSGCPVTALSDMAFCGCPQVTEILLPQNAQAAEGAFDDCPTAEVTYWTPRNLLIYASSDRISVYQSLIDEYMAEHTEYAEWVCILESRYPGDAACAVLVDETHPDVYVFCQDQAKRLIGQDRLMSTNTDVTHGQDAAALEGAAAGNLVYAYPLSYDNGYFLYYDPTIVTHPGDLYQILNDCQENNAVFCMDLTSGWYNISFFFGTGCKLEYSTSYEGTFVGSCVDVASAAGLDALKAMISVAKHPAFVNGTSISSVLVGAQGRKLGAIVSGSWDKNSLPGFSSCKLPAFDTYQMGGFCGLYYAGVNPSQDPERNALAQSIAALLSSEEAQVRIWRETGALPTRGSARARVQLSQTDQAQASQYQFSTPQGQYPGDYWSIASALGAGAVNGEYDNMTDSELAVLLQQYQTDLQNLVVR